MEKEKTKFSLVRLFSAIMFVLITALLVGGGTWYYMDMQSRADKESTDKQVTELQKQIENLKNSTKKEADNVANWKTFEGVGFSVKYPSDWVFKDYSKLSEGADMVGFADKTSNLAPEQSDGNSVVDISWSKVAIDVLKFTSSPDKLKTESATLGSGLTARKFTLLPGRSDDLDGDTKSVIYEVKLASGSYVFISNRGDVKSDIFEKMAMSVK